MKETIANTKEYYRKAALYYLIAELLSFIPSTFKTLFSINFPGNGLMSIAALVFMVLFLNQLHKIATSAAVEKLNITVTIYIVSYVLVFIGTFVTVAISISAAFSGYDSMVAALRALAIFTSLCGLLSSVASIVEFRGHMELVGDYSEKVTKTLKAAMVLVIITIIYTLLISAPSLYTLIDSSLFDNLEGYNGSVISLLGLWGTVLAIASSILGLATIILHYVSLKGIEELATELDAEIIREI